MQIAFGSCLIFSRMTRLPQQTPSSTYLWGSHILLHVPFLSVYQLTLSTTKKNLISKASGASLFFNELRYTAHSYCFAKTRLSKKDSPQDSWLMVQTCITMNFRISNTSCKVSDLSLHIQTKKYKQSTGFYIFLVSIRSQQQRYEWLWMYQHLESQAVVKAIKQFTSNAEGCRKAKASLASPSFHATKVTGSSRGCAKNFPLG